MTDQTTTDSGTRGETTPRPRRRSMSLDDVSDIYADQADWAARMDWLNGLVTGRYRERLFGTASGRVLDVACGTGTNLRYLPEVIDYVGIDLSEGMIENAREKHPELAVGNAFRVMNAQAMTFPDDSFDTVISSLSTCTFPDPLAALREMGRVCKPDGRILLLEHGRSDVGPIARFQDWRADAHYRTHACRWNQEPLEIVAESGLSVERSATWLVGILTGIEARPP